MSRETPEQVLKSIVDGINSGNLDTLMTLYEPEAAFAPQPGSLAHGLAGVRESLAAFIAMRGTRSQSNPRPRGRWTSSRRWRLVIHRNRIRWQTRDADGPQRGCAASSSRRLVALRDRQAVGNRLNPWDIGREVFPFRTHSTVVFPETAKGSPHADRWRIEGVPSNRS
jgi:hypothetical protein